MSKPFLILQLRPEDIAANDEFEAFVAAGGLDRAEIRRIRMERDELPALNLDDYSAVIVGGGPSNVGDTPDKRNPAQKRFEAWLEPILNEIIERDFPYLGACYGLGLLSRVLGAKVSKDRYSEPVTPVKITLTEAGVADPLLKDLPDNFWAFVGHKEAVQHVPESSILLASSETCPIQLVKLKTNIYGSQFHPEANNVIWERRIRTYEHAGYFRPEEMEDLIAAMDDYEVTIPVRILKRFVDRYRN